MKQSWVWLVLVVMGLAMAESNQALSFESVFAKALKASPTLASASASLESAAATLKAREADPTTLVSALNQARQARDLAEVQLDYARIQLLRDVLAAYLDLYEAQRNLEVLKAQRDYAARGVAVAEAKLESGNATALDVQKARVNLEAAEADLASAEARMGLLWQKLEAAVGAALPRGSLAALPEPAPVAAGLEALEAGLEARLPTLVTSAQALATAELNVRLADNDYTPRANLWQARTNLENARRALETAKTEAKASLWNAYLAAKDAWRQFELAKKQAENARVAFAQMEVAYRVGTASLLTLEGERASLAAAQYASVKAQGAYWRALAALSLAAGRDLTGLLERR